MSLSRPLRVARASVSLIVKQIILQALLPLFWVQNAVEPWLKGAEGPMQHVDNEQ